MDDSAFPVTWTGHQAVIELPEHVDVIGAGRLREQLLVTLNRGAAVLIVDMSRTASCDHAGADALARAYQRATVAGSQLRLVVSDPLLRRLLSVEGIDRLVSVYPTLDAAIAAGRPNSAGPQARSEANGRPASGQERPRPAASGNDIAPPTASSVALWQLLDALGDGLVLTDQDGQIVAVNRRCTEMFGYGRGELTGQPVELLVPADLRSSHRRFRDEYGRAPVARRMADRARLIGLRKDGASLPVQISLTPVATATGFLVLVVIRDASEAWGRQDVADLARAAVAEPSRRVRDMLDRVVDRLFQVGLSLQAAADMPGDVARERIIEAVDELDETIREIRDHSYGLSRDWPGTDPGPPAGGR
jgi:anti-anti-sigma factor